MGINFNGSTDSLTIGSAGLQGFDMRFGTIAVVLNLASVPASNSGIFITNLGSGGCIDFYIAGTGRFMGWYDGTTFRESTIAVPLNETVILAATKATGTATARMHMYQPSTNVWTHANTAGTNVNSAANTSVMIGDSTATIPLFCDMFQIAAWARPTFQTDNSCERLSRTPNWDWLRHHPEFYWRFTNKRESLPVIRSVGRFRCYNTAKVGTSVGAIQAPGGFGSSPVNRRR